MKYLESISNVSMMALSALLLAEPGCRRDQTNPEGREAPSRPAPEARAAPPNPDRVDSAAHGEAAEPAPQVKDPMADVDKDMGRVLAALRALGGKPIESLSPEEARKQPTPADAVKAVLSQDGKPVAPEPVAKVQDRAIKVATGTLPIRIYTPADETTAAGTRIPVSTTGARPVIVYYHGGGFVIATNDVYDATPRALANGTRALVVSVEYRKAPEHKFPSAHDDAFAAYRWVAKNAPSFGGDPQRIAVAGESAGGNLAENVAIAARDQHERPPTHVLLVYPVASANLSSESYVANRDAKPLNKEMMIWFTDKYFRTPEDAKDPRINLVAAKLQDLPPTTIINAAIDPLLSDGEELKKQLEAAHVPVEQKTYQGVTHEFFGMGAVVGDAKDAMKLACERLKDSFEKTPPRSQTALAN